jgi:hypothetical protein
MAKCHEIYLSKFQLKLAHFAKKVNDQSHLLFIWEKHGKTKY